MTTPPESENAYEPPRAALVKANSGAERDAILAYIDGEEPNESVSQYYDTQLRRDISGDRFSFHLPALLFGPVWCFWRKLYLVGLALYLAEFVATTVTYVAMALVLPGGESSPHLQAVWLPALLFTRVPAALFANRLYFRAARRAVQRLLSRGATVETLRSRGGTSPLGVGIAILINIAFRALDRLAA